MLKTKEKKEPPNYEEIISTLTSELESLRHQLAVKTHNQLLLKLQDKENQQQTSNKTDKKIKEITTHFQEEIKLTKEIIDSQNILNSLNSKLNDKQFALYKLQTTKEETTTKINIPNKIKETNSQISKLKEQINTQNQILNEKKRFYMELYKKREIFETYLGIKNNNTNNNNNSNLFYLYNRFVYEINNLNNEYSRRHKMNLVNQSNMKIQTLLEQ
jgi:chromosome segregation ATPase